MFSLSDEAARRIRRRPHCVPPGVVDTQEPVGETFASRPIGLVALLCVLGCAAPPLQLGPPPTYVRADGPFEPEELSRDVIICSERARERVAAEFTGHRGPLIDTRRALRERTSVCMGWKGWMKRERPEGPAE
jgi:hypothetical protein